MKRILLALLILVTACGENKKAAVPTTEEKTEKQVIPMYVASPAGLILRDSASLDAAPVKLIKYGNEVLVTLDKSVQPIQAGKTYGQVLPATHEGTEGYAYTGYLSVYPSPDPGEAFTDYVGRISPFFPDVELTNENGEVRLFLPSASLPVAFYYTKRFFSISDRFPLPDPQGQPTDSLKFENPENPERYTKMTVNRKGDRIASIAFDIHGEDFQQQVSLLRLPAGAGKREGILLKVD